jgi:hypothetical protein
VKHLRDLDASLVLVTERGDLHKIDDHGFNAVLFDCPCGEHSNLVAFEPTIGGAPRARSGLTRDGGTWKREGGETVDDLTLSPSIAVRSRPNGGECWHGYVRGGEVTSC